MKVDKPGGGLLNEGDCERDTQDRLDDLFRSMVGKRITYPGLVA